MKIANYLVLGEVFNLLERLELTYQIPLNHFDPNDVADVDVIAERFIRPALRETNQENRDVIRRSLEFYSQTGSAPFQVLRDRCQDLSLPEIDSYELFLKRLGRSLFGEEFDASASPAEYHELLDEMQARQVFASK